jgi:hypothetical protein
MIHRDDTLHTVAWDAPALRVGKKTSSHERASCMVEFEVDDQDQSELKTFGSVPKNDEGVLTEVR